MPRKFKEIQIPNYTPTEEWLNAFTHFIGALFGVVVTDIPDGAWATLTVTITADEEVLYTGATTYAE